MKLKKSILNMAKKARRLIKDSRFFSVIGIIFILSFVLWAVFGYAPKKVKQYQMRTRFFEADESLGAVKEEKAKEEISGRCEEIRKSADKLYSIDEIADEIQKTRESEKIKLIGKDESNSEKNKEDKYLLFDIRNKEIELVCFDFSRRVIVEGEGEIDFSLNNFKNIEGNALGLKSGEGKISHNLFENSSKSGIFANGGKWEIYGNIIKNNLSYGVYGDYQADLILDKNAIFGNGGYEVRILKERKVYE
jgi:hypothetical protein